MRKNLKKITKTLSQPLTRKSALALKRELKKICHDVEKAAKGKAKAKEDLKTHIQNIQVKRDKLKRFQKELEALQNRYHNLTPEDALTYWKWKTTSKRLDHHIVNYQCEQLKCRRTFLKVLQKNLNFLADPFSDSFMEQVKKNLPIVQKDVRIASQKQEKFANQIRSFKDFYLIKKTIKQMQQSLLDLSELELQFNSWSEKGSSKWSLTQEISWSFKSDWKKIQQTLLASRIMSSYSESLEKTLLVFDRQIQEFKKILNEKKKIPELKAQIELTMQNLDQIKHTRDEMNTLNP